MTYSLPPLEEFRKARRGLPVIAAVLFVASLLFPMWQIAVDAVQYPTTTLKVNVYAFPRLTGDVREMAALNHYVGFHYPDPVYWAPNYDVSDAAIDAPEWSLGPVGFLAVGGLSLFVALAPDTERLRRGLTWQLVGTGGLFTVMLADIQYRLYQAGHRLDPNAPVMGVEGFTPPLMGTYQVANITSTSRFGPGAGMAMVAIGFLVIAFYYRKTTVKIGELPGRFVRGTTRLLPLGDDGTDGSIAKREH